MQNMMQPVLDAELRLELEAVHETPANPVFAGTDVNGARTARVRSA
jgi:hypothetical protein